MPQTKFSQFDGISFDPVNATDVKITTSSGEMVFYDEEITGGVTLSKLCGLENIGSVFIVGLIGDGAAYNTIQAALDAVDNASSETSPSVILVCSGVYAEALTIQKDGVVIIGLGEVVIQGTAGNSSVLINDVGGVVPKFVELRGLTIEKDQAGECCVEVQGALDTELLTSHLLLQDCVLKATGVGSYTVKADKADTIKIYQGDWGDSLANSICSISQVAYFDCVGVRKGCDFQLSYDSTLDAPLDKTSEYLLADLLDCGDFLISVSGTGSVSLTRATLDDLSVTGDRQISFRDCGVANLTVQGTITATMESSTYSSIAGDVTTVLNLDKLVGSAAFVNVASVSVSLPLPYPDTSYMVLVDGYDAVHPHIENKTVNGFDISYSDGVNKTLTAYYQVLKV